MHVVIYKLLFSLGGYSASSSATSSRQCDSTRTIAPSHQLLIREDMAGTLNCSAPCAGFNTLFFRRPDNGLNRTNDAITSDNSIFGSVVGRVRTVTVSENCTRPISSLVNISWTANETIRRELDAAICVFVYSTGSGSEICITDVVPIVFLGKFVH